MINRWFFIRSNSENSFLDISGPFLSHEEAAAVSKLRFETTIQDEFGPDHVLEYDASGNADFGNDVQFYSRCGDAWSYSDDSYACSGDVYLFNIELTKEEQKEILRYMTTLHDGKERA